MNGISQNSNALQGNGGLPKLSLEETACILVVPDTLLNSAISSNSATPPTATQSIGGNQLSIVQRPNCLESLKTMPMLSVPAQIAKFSLILVSFVGQDSWSEASPIGCPIIGEHILCGRNSKGGEQPFTFCVNAL